MIQSSSRAPRPTLIVRAIEDCEATEAVRFVDAGGPEIHVWRASLQHPPASVADLRSTLSQDDRARCARLRSSRHRRRCTVGRGVLRLVLARYTGKSPHELTFRYGDAGKPLLRDPPGPTSGSRLHFNLSHSDELMLIAVSHRAPVGIDVERLRPIMHMEEIAERWLLADEYQAIRRAPTAMRKAQLFFAAWTSAEARAKASGEGLLGSLKARRRGREGRGSAPLVFRPAPGFVAAVAFGAPLTPTAPRDRDQQPDPGSTI